MTDEVYRTDIPLPPPKNGHGVNALAMGCPVGASFFVPLKNTNNNSNLLWRARKKGMKFSARKVTENGVAGIRIWRTA